MDSKKKIKFKGQIDTYFRFQMVMTALWIIAVIICFFIDYRAGIVAGAAFVIYQSAAVIVYNINRVKVMDRMVDFALNYSKVQSKLLYNFEIPYALVDSSGTIVWVNKKFSEFVDVGNVRGRDISTVLPGCTKESLNIDGDENHGELKIEMGERSVRIRADRLFLSDEFDESGMIDAPYENTKFAAIYLFDETEKDRLEKENREDKLCSGLIYIDNYEEVLQSVENAKRSLLIALIERKISKYIGSFDGIVQRMERDKYFFAIKAKYVDTLRENKFSLLEEVKSVNIGNDMFVTISIGLGVGGTTYEKNTELAKSAMETALGRGGDQAVIKTTTSTAYYGGKTQSVERNTRVKSRVKATALKEIVKTRERVFIMGHRAGDADSFGAAIGLYRAIKTQNKEIHIVINDISSTVRPLFDRFGPDDGYEPDLFLTSEKAISLFQEDDLVIVVDVNRPSIVECPQLLEAKSIVVFDHHRQGTERIENPLLSYIETYVSSTCEMVTEMIQYFDEYIKLKQQEADAMYGGIMIDTNSFSNRTGARTFEAAAFLRKNGADVSRVKKMFRDDMADYKAKAAAICNAEIFMDLYAITICPANGLESPNVVGAQAANELLNIKGVRASFVVTDFNNKMYISARSIDEVNVQLIMERLGGGGHINLAGAQIENASDVETVGMIKDAIRTMSENGEI